MDTMTRHHDTCSPACGLTHIISLAPSARSIGLDYQLRRARDGMWELVSPEGEEYTSRAGRRVVLSRHDSRADATAAAPRCDYCDDAHGGLTPWCPELEEGED